jgi:hypothetical protein
VCIFPTSTPLWDVSCGLVCVLDMPCFMGESVCWICRVLQVNVCVGYVLLVKTLKSPLLLCAHDIGYEL